MVNKLLDSKLLFIGILFLSLNFFEVWSAEQITKTSKDSLKTNPYKYADALTMVYNVRNQVGDSSSMWKVVGLSHLFAEAVASISQLTDSDLNYLDNWYKNNPCLINERMPEKYHNKTVLMHACKSLHVGFVTWLLEHGADPLMRNDEDRTCLDTLNIRTGFDQNNLEDPYHRIRSNGVKPEIIDRAKEIRKLLVQKIAENASKKA